MTTRDSDRPTAVVLQRISLNDSVDDDAFERVMLEEVFPSANTAGDGEEPDTHVLLGGADREYVWLSQLRYEIHQTPLPQWLLNRVEALGAHARERLAAFGPRAAPEVHYDVRAWRRRLGK